MIQRKKKLYEDFKGFCCKKDVKTDLLLLTYLDKTVLGCMRYYS